VLLEQRKEKRAGEVFDEANSIAMGHQFREHRIDMHMRVFDYKLPGKLNSKKEALHAWAVAMLEAIVMDDGEVVANVVGHVVTQMTAVNLAPSLSELHSLRSDLSATVSDAFPRDKWLVDVVLQPLDLVERLLPSVGKPLKMARQVKGFIKELNED
jgi:hypothetical protein